MSSRDLHINMPSTPLPMEARLMERVQPEILQKWRAMDIYRMILEDRRTADPFILHDGPPFAAGETHVGIGFNKILKDVITKYWAMRGRRVPFVPGWDCHGLPIEAEVLRELKGRPASALEIRELCAAHVADYVGQQKEHFQTLGVFADWERPYLTMAPAYEAGVLGALAEVHAKGYVYRGLRPVHWCHICETVLADAEVRPREAQRLVALIPFQLEAHPGVSFGEGADELFVLAPSRDVWALPPCVALAVNPEATFVALSFAGEGGARQTLLVERGSAGRARDAFGLRDAEEVGEVAGERLGRASVKHPITQRAVPVILDKPVAQMSPYGALPVTPAHYADDYALADRHGLEMSRMVDRHAEFTEEAGILRGFNVREAEEAILGLLKDGRLPPHVGRATCEESYGARCGHAVIMLPTQQWFVRVDHREEGHELTLRQRALQEVDNLIKWVHEKEDRQSMHHMIETRPDWCISRQRHWGVPIPALACLDCGEVTLRQEVIEEARDLVAARGSGAWLEVGLEEFLSAPRLRELRCEQCGGGRFGRDPEASVLDVWFESGTSWRSALVADHRLSFPADLCVEGGDQHRGWFQMSLLLSLMVEGRPPFKSVFTHGLVLDEKRKTMSKLDKNFVSLKQALNEVPVDLLRLYFVRNKNIRQDFPLSIQSILALEPEYRTFRNCFRYLLGNLRGYSAGENTVPLERLSDVDKWVLCRLHKLVDDVTDLYSTYKFKEAIDKLYTFCDYDLNKVYFEAVRDLLKYDAAAAPARRSTQTAMHSLLVALVKMLAPVLVYTCEEVWGLSPGVYDCASVHLSLWPAERNGLTNRLREEQSTLLEEFDWAHGLRKGLQVKFEQLRRAGEIGDNSDARLTLYAPPANALGAAVLARPDLQMFLNVAEVRVPDTPQGLEPLPEVEEVYCLVERSPHPECLRCRRPDPSVGADRNHPSYCARCVGVLEGQKVSRADGPPPPVDGESRPAEVAEYMRRRGIRKVALLNEGGEVRAYYFDLPSQQVRVHPELQALADYVGRGEDFRQHRAVLLGLGEHTDVLFGIGIHQLKRGTPLGGTREFTYGKVGEMLTNLLRLSYGMSIKNSIGDLPHGGGKSIIDTCGLDLKVHRELRRRIYRDFGQFTATLSGRYICAEDMNNTSADTREMLSWCRHVMCLPEGVGGGGNPSRFTSLVGWLAARAGWKFWSERERGGESPADLAGVTVAVQGVGNVGYNLIDILTEGEPGLKKILIADTEATQIEAVRKLLRRKGKEHLLELRSAQDPLPRQGATPEQVAAVRGEMASPEDEGTYVLYSACDILVPAAVGDVIRGHNVGLLNCKVIVPIANNAYHDNDVIGRMIWERKIVDVVEGNVNWGGATVAASELYGYDEEHVIKWSMQKVYRETLDLLARSEREGVPPWEIKKREAEETMQQPHPIVKTARDGHYIVDASEDFARWIKERWLPGISGVGPFKFARHVADRTRDYLPV